MHMTHQMTTATISEINDGCNADLRAIKNGGGSVADRVAAQIATARSWARIAANSGHAQMSSDLNAWADALGARHEPADY